MFKYGTAGFRRHSDQLNTLALHLAWIIPQLATHDNVAYGIMITASHNSIDDNGFKIFRVDSKIPFIDEQTETLLEQYVNEMKMVTPKTPTNGDVKITVYIGYDTRPSSKILLEILKTEMAKQANVTIVDLGLCGTPQCFALASKSISTVSDYNILKSLNSKTPTVFIDCANGVCASMLETINNPNFVLFNKLTSTKLNDHCGADFVYSRQTWPIVHDGICVQTPWTLVASVDGDGDRLVYYCMDDERRFHIFDGSKIAILFAHYWFRTCAKEQTCAMIQTAYTNGAATNYFRQHFPHIPIVVVPTGMKYLYREAIKYDCAIFFEPNGHGSVWCKEMNSILSNPFGDAIANLLFVQQMLCQITVQDWFGWYTNYFSKHTSIPLSCVKPNARFDEIRPLPHQRIIVRPSGTEPIIRVYVESNKNETDEIIETVLQNLV